MRNLATTEPAPAPWLFLVDISSDGTVEVLENAQTMEGGGFWRASDPKYRVNEHWVRDQYPPHRWLIPKPAISDHYRVIVSISRPDARDYYSAEWQVHLYAAALAVRVLGLEDRVAQLQRHADGYHYCPHCKARYALTGCFRKHLTWHHHDGAGDYMYTDEFWETNEGTRKAWLAQRSDQ